MINAVAGKRKQGLSTGEYLLAAMINRAVSPVAKIQLESRYRTTMLSQWMPASEGMLSSQRFWDNTNRWDEENIEKFELKFLKKLVSEYQIFINSYRDGLLDGSITNLYTDN